MKKNNESKSKILVIEDDPTIVQGLVTALEFNGFAVKCAGDSAAGMLLLGREKPDLVILDIMLPGLDGFSICEQIRAQDEKTPIIILSAKNQESDKVLGFELGADDYVTKPFSARELIARIKVNLKRVAQVPAETDRLDIGDVTVDFNNFTVTRDGSECALSPKEQKILKLLVQNPNRVISRDRIIDRVWGDEYYPTPKTVDNFIRKLRVKIEKEPAAPQHILSVHGAGYKFKP